MRHLLEESENVFNGFNGETEEAFGPAAPSGQSPPRVDGAADGALPVRLPPPPVVPTVAPDPGAGVRTAAVAVPDAIVPRRAPAFGPSITPSAPGILPMRPDPIEFEVPIPESLFSSAGEPFVHKRIGSAIAGFLSAGPVGAVAGFVGPSSSRAPSTFTGADRGTGLGAPRSCQQGFRLDAGGRCVATGIVGAAQRFIPGGATGVQGAEFGAAVMGSFGMPALEPAQVGSITRKDGSVGPILRCPPGSVLAIDNLCYNKGVKGLASFRKWPPGTRPFLTGGEVRILRRAETLRRGKGTKKTLKALGLGG